MQIKLQGFKQKAFSTLEIIIFIVVIATILSFLAPKFNTFLEKNDLVKLKSDIALIRNGISKQNRIKSLKQDFTDINELDSAKVNVSNEKLFEYVIDFPSISTSTKDSKNGYWAKISKNNYIFFLKNSSYEFSLNNSEFLCVSSDKLCEDLL